MAMRVSRPSALDTVSKERDRWREAHPRQPHDGGQVCRVAGEHPRLIRRLMRPKVTPLSPLPIQFITFLAAQRSNQGLVYHLAG